MDFCTLLYRSGQGWSVPLPAHLDSEQTLLLAFGNSRVSDDPKPIHELLRAFPRAVFMGCSTAGQISGVQIFDDELSVAVLRFRHSTLRAASSALLNAGHSREAGQALARQLIASGAPRAILVFSTGVGVNGSELVAGINAITKGDVIVTGGLAGDGDRFQHTWVIDEGEPREARVTAVGLYGDKLEIAFGSGGGWDIFGPERRITRSTANVLHELDGKPALALYKSYLGDRAAGLPATALLFPLALRENTLDERRLVRTVLAVDESDQSMVFAGDVPEGSLVQLMRANFERLIEGAGAAALQTRAPQHAAGPVFALAVSCVGRRLVLRERAEEEVEMVSRALPEGSALIGFYSYGEFAPRGVGTCDLHNQTMTITTITER
jgi:hypothetical protein